jgi:threonine dehydrogenase-like Zn-dependent dehydrogenase
MKAVVWHGVGDVRLEDVGEPKIEQPTDAIVRITASAMCGTDLHFVRGTFSGMEKGQILGHEAVGVVEEVGKGVRNLRAGDRVVVPSTVGCGHCSYCRAGYYAQCDNANPNGKTAGTAFFGGPKPSGPLKGLQAEYARVPFAHVNLVKLPQSVTDDQAIMLSDIFPTGYFGADVAEIEDGDIVCVFGCGPVGQFAVKSAQLLGAGRVIAVDAEPSRLEMARAQGAEVVNFDEEDPLEAIKELTGGAGPDRAIDAVGVDAAHAHHGPAARQAAKQAKAFAREVEQVAPDARPESGFAPGDAPSQALRWAVESLAKAGTLSIIGVYPPQHEAFPIGQAMNKNLTIQMGNCNHRKYIPHLVELVESGAVDPRQILTQVEPMTDVLSAYRAFNDRRPGWIKVELRPAA